MPVCGVGMCGCGMDVSVCVCVYVCMCGCGCVFVHVCNVWDRKNFRILFGSDGYTKALHHTLLSEVCFPGY